MPPHADQGQSFTTLLLLLCHLFLHQSYTTLLKGAVTKRLSGVVVKASVSVCCVQSVVVSIPASGSSNKLFKCIWRHLEDKFNMKNFNKYNIEEGQVPGTLPGLYKVKLEKKPCAEK